MRHSALLAVPMLVLSFAGSAGEPRPLTPEESDTLIYVRSVGADPMKAMCEPMTRSMPDFETTFTAWKARSKDAVERGRQAQAAQLKSGETLEGYEQGVRDAINARLANTPPDRVAMQCLGFIASLRMDPPD